MNPANNGIDFIGDCVRLIKEALPLMRLTHIGYPYIEVSVHPCVILTYDAIPHINLCARSLAGIAVCVNMDLPGIRRTLGELAESGAPWTDFQAVRYYFDTPVCNSTAVGSTMINSGVSNLTIANSGVVDDSTLVSSGVVELTIPDSINLDDYSFDGEWIEKSTTK
ncbi:hypothetical protein Neosp_004022 [[Neocosmospora] mangrovei]